MSLELLKLWTLLPSRSPSSTFWGEKCGIIGFEKKGGCWINNENVFSSLTIPTCSGRKTERMRKLKLASDESRGLLLFDISFEGISFNFPFIGKVNLTSDESEGDA